MSPSINELTRERKNLGKNDQFELHANGAKRLTERHEGRVRFQEGDVLTYPRYTNLDVPYGDGSESVWMHKGQDGFQVPSDEDLFSKKI